MSGSGHSVSYLNSEWIRVRMRAPILSTTPRRLAHTFMDASSVNIQLWNADDIVKVTERHRNSTNFRIATDSFEGQRERKRLICPESTATLITILIWETTAASIVYGSTALNLELAQVEKVAPV